MNLTQEHVSQAVIAGLDLLDPNKELVDVYRRHASGLVILRTVLEAIGAGQIVLTQPTPPPGAQTPADVEEDDD